MFEKVVTPSLVLDQHQKCYSNPATNTLPLRVWSGDFAGAWVWMRVKNEGNATASGHTASQLGLYTTHECVRKSTQA